MRNATPKRAKQLREYAKKRTAFLEANPACWRCLHRATEIHHQAGRRGAALLDESRWMAACRDCHRLITEQPQWAIENGWSLPRIGAA